MSTSEQRRMLADLLEKVGCQQISAKDAISEIERWTEYPWKEKELSDAFHLLFHFDADANIREKRQEYAAAQTSQLLERANRLRS